jgi:hypothetical protein
MKNSVQSKVGEAKAGVMQAKGHGSMRQFRGMLLKCKQAIAHVLCGSAQVHGETANHFVISFSLSVGVLRSSGHSLRFRYPQIFSGAVISLLTKRPGTPMCG